MIKFHLVNKNKPNNRIIWLKQFKLVELKGDVLQDFENVSSI